LFVTHPPIIQIRNIGKRFDGVAALHDVSFEIAPGTMHAIVGENGAGKSTLMKILAGVLTDYEGELIVRGEPVRFAATRDAEHAGISIIHQELNLVEQLSSAANIFLGREHRTRLGLLDDAWMERQTLELFDQLDCDIDPRGPVGTLRVGDQQLVEIAKALSLESEILIMDEPTSALSKAEVERLFRIIERLLDRGKTVLYISHKMDEVFRRSNVITVLRDGKHVATMAREKLTPREVTHLMVGREIENVALGADRRTGDIILDVRGLSLPWPGHARRFRLQDVSFSLHRGEVLGIAGLLGAGRTELLECLFGASRETIEGRILLDGREVRFRGPADAMRSGMALVTEDRKRIGLFSHMTVRENITLCRLADATTAGLVSPGRERAMARESIEWLGVKTATTEAPVASLSGGNQQKCIIARWLRTDPKVLLLDDPTRGIDVGAKAEIYKIIDKLCRDGLGMIVTSSELPELIALCDRILVLCEGRLTGEFRRSEFTEQAIMEAATRRQSTGDPGAPRHATAEQ
jgi:ABC-type sugar transport system ATPase subunit